MSRLASKYIAAQESLDIQLQKKCFVVFFNSIVHSASPAHFQVQDRGSYNVSTIFCLTKAKVLPPPLGESGEL